MKKFHSIQDTDYVPVHYKRENAPDEVKCTFFSEDSDIITFKEKEEVVDFLEAREEEHLGFIKTIINKEFYHLKKTKK